MGNMLVAAIVFRGGIVNDHETKIGYVGRGRLQLFLSYR